MMYSAIQLKVATDIAWIKGALTGFIVGVAISIGCYLLA